MIRKNFTVIKLKIKTSDTFKEIMTTFEAK